MIPASPEFKQILRTALSMQGSLRLLAEWNMNRHYTGEVSNNGEPDDRPEFPMSSVVEPLRPTKKGIVKMIIDDGYVQPEYMNAVPSARFYVTSDDDLYHYWVSKETAKTLSGSNNTFSFDTPQRPTVIYPELVYTNKIVIGLETSLARPVSYSVQTTTNGTAWSTIAVNPTVDQDGKIVLYLQQSGSWGASAYYSNITRIRGVRLVVNTMDQLFSRLSVIEISPRIENDLSTFVQDWSSSFELSDVSDLAPIGRASSNGASVTLSNVDLRFNNENEESLYYGMMDKNVKMTLDFGLKMINGSYEYVRQFTMYAESFSPSDEMTIVANLTDSATYLQTVTVPALYLENHTVGAVIWKLMDIAGFTNYHYNVRQDDSQIVPYFWTDGESTLWDVIAGLAETTQTAVYFDEYDVMRIQTKSMAFDTSRAIDWNLRATDAPGLAANIETLSQDRVFETNKLDVTYYPTEFSDFNNGIPKMEVSWEPEGMVLLRSATLTKSILRDSEWLSIDQQKSETWPYSAMVNIDGEMIRYEGKHYYYYDPAGGVKEAILKSKDEKESIDKDPAKSSELLAWKNHFSGNFKIVERGCMGTQIKDHAVYNWNPAAPGNRYAGAYINWNSFQGIGFYNRATFNNSQGVLTLTTDASYGWVDMHLVHNGWADDLVSKGNFGTRVRFAPSGFPTNQGVAGLHFCGGSSGQGFYVGLHPTDSIEAAGRNHNEVVAAVKGSDGRTIILGSVEAQIDRGVWYDLEARVLPIGTPSDGHYRLSVYLNGAHAGTHGLLFTYHENLGRSGVWVRSHTSADFEYLYAFEDDRAGTDDPENMDSPGGRTLDVIYGGYRSNTVYSRIKYNSIYSPWDKRYGLVGDWFFDEFTPVVHEVREIEADFKEAPVIHSYPYTTNDDAMILEYNSDPFGGKLMIANAARVNAVVHGEDTTTTPDSPINHTMMIYGRLLNQEDAQHAISENLDSIRARGLVETKIDSKWIQSEAAAKAIGDWAVGTFGHGADEVEATIFPVPILQIGDLVTVSHPGFNMLTSSHKYFVTATNKTWEDGFTMTVSLKRIKI